jgi:polar amino acid transport system substrate-binding protein
MALLVLALFAIVAVVAACGGEETTTTAAPTETTAAPTETTAAPAAYDINTIVAGIKVDEAAAALVPEKYKSAPVKVGSDAPYPPWEMFVEGTDQFTGFDYDLAQAIGAKLGVKFEFVAMKFDSLLIGLEAGNIDVIMSSMYDFVSYAKDGTALLVPKGNPDKIAGWMDLAGKNVGCEKGTTQATNLAKLNEKFKAEGKPEMTISEFPDQPAAILALQSGKIAADLTDASTGAYVAQTTDGGNALELVVDPNPPAGLGFELKIDGIAVGKTNTGLRDGIQKGLQALMDDGTYKTILDHYGLQPYPKAEINASKDPGSGE